MRWSGIRCPSELKIKISEVLWDKSKMLIHSPKTAHHEGRESRWIPIFQEVAPLLEEAIDHARDGAVYVLGSRRNSPHTTLARQYGNILRLAGVAPYGKPFVNLRSSRETDLANAGVPWHLIQMWMGHSEKVSRDHYMQVLDGNFTHWSSVVPKETEVVPQLVPQTVAANQ
jgi:integrase